MFITSRQSEHVVAKMLDSSIQAWPYVQHTNVPLVHVSVLQGDGEPVPNPIIFEMDAFARFCLAEPSPISVIAAAAIVTPPSINQSQNWRMEPLVELEELSGRGGARWFCGKTLEGNAYELRGSVSPKTRAMDRRRVYLAAN